MINLNFTKFFRLVEPGAVNNPNTEPFLTQFFKKQKTNFSVIGNRLKYQGQDLGQQIAENAYQNPAFLAQVAHELEKLRQDCLEKMASDEIQNLVHLCEVYLHQIAIQQKNRFDEGVLGVHIFFDPHGQLVMNGINLNGLIEQCQRYATPKARIFLGGIRHKLYLILSNPTCSRLYEKMNNTVLEMLKDIDLILRDSTHALTSFEII